MIKTRIMTLIILEKLRDKLLERTSLSGLPESVWKKSAALNTWGTNAIEGSTISWKDTEKLLLDGITVPGKPIRDVLETIQHEKAFKALPDRAKQAITLETVLELHEDVFWGILPDVGQWRRVNVRIRGAAFTPPRMEKVLREMKAWLDEYNRRDLEGEDTFELAAWLHFEFERIHPFSDGNGRVGRLLLNLHFLKRNWPLVHVLPSHRDEYLEGLEAAALGDFSKLVKLFRTLSGASLIDLLDQVGTAQDALISLKDAAKHSPYSEQYLALRCKQGELPAMRKGREWRTSKRALALYGKLVGRK